MLTENKKKLLIIVPAYNEQSSICSTLQSISGMDYVVVNDGSVDNTAAVCMDIGASCISLPFNEGLSGAFQTGMIYAYEHGYQYALQFDADGQHLPQYIEPMLKKAEETGCDIVIGSRFLDSKHGNSVRQIGASLIRLGIKLTTGRSISDPTSGMRMYNRKMIELFAKNINYSPEPDTLAYLMRNGASVKEVSVVMAERTAGKSYLTFWKSIKYMLKTVIAILLIQYIRPSVSIKEINI